MKYRGVEFALYKGEELLAIGTTEEIAKQLNNSVSTIVYYRSKAYKRRIEKRNTKNARLLIPIEE